MAYDIIWEDKGVNVVFTGNFDDAGLTNSTVEISSHQNFASIKYELYDLGKVDKITVTSKGIIRVAELDATAYDANPDIKVAVVASALVIKGLLNMYRTYFEIDADEKSWETKYFESLEEARSWIEA